MTAIYNDKLLEHLRAANPQHTARVGTAASAGAGGRALSSPTLPFAQLFQLIQ